MEINDTRKRKLLDFFLIFIILGVGMFSISEINNYENNKNKLIEKSISLINEKFSDFDINQNTILVKKIKSINIDSYTWLITYKKILITISILELAI